VQQSLRERIQRIETILQEQTWTRPSEPHQSISDAVTGIERLLQIEPDTEPAAAILTPLRTDHSSPPATLFSPTGSQASLYRTPFLGEANHKRWGADSAIGQSFGKAQPFDLSRLTIDIGDGSSPAGLVGYSRSSWG
jgi:hypothetical protein